MRPVISFLTDFGPDAAAGICRGVMLGIAPDAQIVDLSHSVRKYAVRDGAFLLRVSLPSMPIGVHVGVVDPGVGTERRPIGILAGRGDVLIGPDNGLLTAAADRLGGIREVRALENRAWMLPHPSSTFHGRDIFSPMAAHLAAGGAFEEVGPLIDVSTITRIHVPEAAVRDGALESTVVYVDSFGNLRLGGHAADLARAVGPLEPGRPLRVEFLGGGGPEPVTEVVPWAQTFGEVPTGSPLLYEDSFGGLAYADNQANVAARLAIEVGRAVRIAPA